MIRFLVTRLVSLLLTLWVVATLSFFLVRAAPGDPFASEFRGLSASALESRKREFHLNEPLSAQYKYWLQGIARGDFGPSMKYGGKTVNDIISQTFPTSVALGSVAMVMALALGMTTGVIAAVRQNSMVDYGLMALAVVGNDGGYLAPCGRCRQVLNELAQLGDTDPVIWCDGQDGVLELRLSALLPHAFGPANLG